VGQWTFYRLRSITPSPLLDRPSAIVPRCHAHFGGEGAGHRTEGTGDIAHAGAQDYPARGVLARAQLQRVRGGPDAARRDLEEALEIATRGGMRLHEADCHLEYARLHLACGDKPAARESLAQARKLVQECGYHRRDAEVQELGRQVLS
jgi:hypothetical protein